MEERLSNAEFDIELQGKKYKLSYNLNAIEELTEIYGTMGEAIKALRQNESELKRIRHIKTWLRVGINHGNDLELTDKQVGKMLFLDSMNETLMKITHNLVKK